MNYVKLLTISISILFIGACSSTPETKFTADGTGIVKAQKVDPMTLNDVEWDVIRSKEELDKYIEDNGLPYFILSREEFNNLGSNFVEVIRYTKDQESSIHYYENIIDKIDKTEKE